MFVRPNHIARRALKVQPGEITRKSSHERLGKGQKQDEQAGVDGVEFRFDTRPHHVRERDAERAAKHQIRDNAQHRQKNSEPKKKNREREPFDTAQIDGHVRLRSGIDRLKKTVAENSVINNRPINEPTEAGRSINLAAPFRRAGWAEENQMFEAQQRFRFAVAVLLFQESAQGEAAMMPYDGGWAESDDATSLLKSPAKIDIVAGVLIFGIDPVDVLKGPSVEGHVTPGNMLRDCVREQNMARPTRRGGDTGLDPILRRRSDVGPAHSGIFVAHQRAD